MRRESEFRDFLIYFRKGHKHSPSGAEQYVDICHRIEDYMGGRDMEELVVSQVEVDATEAVLKTKGSFKNTRAVLYAYFEFSSSTTIVGAPISPSAPYSTIGTEKRKTYTDVAGLVLYENSVPSYDRITGLCEFIEKEYEKIREFARRVLVDIWQDFPAVPVYLSKERPEKTYYYDREFLLRKMREYCAKCERESCEPPYCRIDGVLEKYAPFTDRINGRYFDGIQRLQELRDKLAKPSIMSAQERLEWLTKLIKSDEESTTDRLRAADIMNKMTGEYVQKIEADVKNEVTINIELSDDE